MASGRVPNILMILMNYSFCVEEILKQGDEFLANIGEEAKIAYTNICFQKNWFADRRDRKLALLETLDTIVT